MIFLNKQKVEFLYYPNGEVNIDHNIPLNINQFDKNIVEYYFDYNNATIFELIIFKKYLDRININNCVLYIPYLPYSRMDRIKDEKKHIFTLKYFTDIINSLNFNKVYTLDCHSDVGISLINNSFNIDSFHELLYDDNSDIKINENDILVFPDLTAYKRYGYLIRNNNYIFLNKIRDFDTGKIVETRAYKSSEDINNTKRAIIIDDLISYGNTFIMAANKIRELLPNIEEVILVISHCEFNSVNKNIENLKSAINKIYTTNSMMYEIFYHNNDFIKIYNCNDYINKIRKDK